MNLNTSYSNKDDAGFIPITSNSIVILTMTIQGTVLNQVARTVHIYGSLTYMYWLLYI